MFEHALVFQFVGELIGNCFEIVDFSLYSFKLLISLFHIFIHLGTFLLQFQLLLIIFGMQAFLFELLPCKTEIYLALDKFLSQLQQFEIVFKIIDKVDLDDGEIGCARE